MLPFINPNQYSDACSGLQNLAVEVEHLIAWMVEVLNSIVLGFVVVPKQEATGLC